jgi:transposase
MFCGRIKGQGAIDRHREVPGKGQLLLGDIRGRHSLQAARGSVLPARLARHFLGLIHRRDVSGIDRWLRRAGSCPVPEMRRFAASLRADLSAVRAAFVSPWSSGQVEGQINRLKFLKRQMYGRAKLDLLRMRVLHPN